MKFFLRASFSCASVKIQQLEKNMGDVISMAASKQAGKVAEKVFWDFVNAAYAGQFDFDFIDPNTGVENFLVYSQTPVDRDMMIENAVEFIPAYEDNVPRIGLVLSDDKSLLVMQIADKRYHKFLPLELGIILEPFGREKFSRVVTLQDTAATL